MEEYKYERKKEREKEKLLMSIFCQLILIKFFT